jgi:hypothetical protein
VQKERFSTLGCAPEGFAPSATQLCYSSLELYKVNPHSPLSGQPTAEASVGGALCVERVNAALETQFYTDNTAALPSNVFSVAAGKKQYSYGDEAPVSATQDANFDRGDLVAAFNGASSATGNLYATTNGFMSLPAADFDGACNDANYVRFEQDVEARSCRREFTASAPQLLAQAECENDFSVSLYVTDLWVGKAAGLGATPPASAAVTRVTLGTVTYRSYDTGVEATVTTDFKSNSCATVYKSYSDYSNIANAACRFCGGGGSQPACPVTNTVPYCQNTVAAVHYTVTHDPDVAGTISAVVADVVITDVPFLDTPIFEQTFSVQFVSASSVAPAQANGNLVPRSRSGNPGYIMGKPVLIGTLSSSVSGAVEMESEGLQVATPFIPFAASAGTFGSSTCPTSGSRGEQSVGFGYDMVTGCEMHLTRGDLANACSSSVPYFLETPSADQYVGQYGNADPLDASQWIKLTKRTATVTALFDPNSGVCSNVITGLHYKFLVASTGERAFPQSKIVAAEVEEVVGEWRSNVPNTDSQSTQAFALQVTVSFIHKDASELTGYVPPTPPVLFKVPHDVFYPFYMSSAAAPAGVSWVGLALPVLACVALLVVGGGN